jgi:hypothetical protein
MSFSDNQSYMFENPLIKGMIKHLKSHSINNKFSDAASFYIYISCVTISVT